jgi:hypothetical protein
MVSVIEIEVMEAPEGVALVVGAVDPAGVQ